MIDIRNPNCKMCELHKHARYPCLIGVGPPNARLMLIGESPGEEEDRKGEPFIGRAGKLLTSILVNTGFKREEVFITNVIKCHPLNNSKPSANQLDTCISNYLRKEIAQVKPELIITLGAIASRALLQNNTSQIAILRNNVWYTKGPLPTGYPFIVTYHPAAVLHGSNDHLLEFIAEDFENARRILDEGRLPKNRRSVIYQRINSLSEIDDIENAEWIDLDLETDGLDAFISGKEILSVQISLKSGIAFYLDWNEKVERELKELLEGDTGIGVNGHNVKHDLKWLRSKAGIIFDGRLNDTIQDIHLVNENFPNKALDVVAPSFTDLKGHKDELKKLINQYIKMNKERGEPIKIARGRLWGKAFKAIPEKIRVNYGCGDADATGRLRRKFRPKLKQDGLMPLHNLMMNVTKLYIDMECNGVKIDTSLISKFDRKYQHQIKEQGELLDDISPIEINHNSPIQMKQLLYDIWKLPNHEIRMGKKRVRYSTGKDAIDLILKDDIPNHCRKYLMVLNDYKKLTKVYGTYIKGLPRFLRDDFIHAQWNLIGADTGRTSCNDPNLQQIPRKGDIKELFTSRYNKGILMQIDISQGELRMAAHISEEPTLIKLFQTGTTDIHRSVAAEALEKSFDEVSDDERYNYKQVNFAVLYGSGARTVAQEMKGATEKEALEVMRRWHRKFTRWKEHVKETEEFIIANGYIRNPFGRYRHLSIIDRYSPEGFATLRKGINSPIQGGLSDYNKLCGYNLFVRLRNQVPKAKFVMEAHDAWVLDLPGMKTARVVAQMVKEEFENVDTSEFGFRFKVPMKVEIKIGPNWKDMEEYAI